MHNCLRVAEILYEICWQVRSQHLLYTRMTRDLAGLARVCKLFHDPALDALYFKVMGVYNVFTTLPQDAWSIEDDVFSFTRPLQLSDWECVFRYSRRIRKLFEPKGASLQLSEETYGAIRLSPYHLFPGLQNLEWRSDAFSRDFILFCCGPTVIKLDVFEMPANFFPSLSIISAACRGLRELEIHPASFKDSDLLQSALEEALPTMHALTKLSVNIMSTIALLRAIHKLPSLRELKIRPLTGSELQSSSSAQDLNFSFASLRSLCIWNSSYHAMARTLDCIGRLPQIESFEGISTSEEGVEYALRFIASQLDPARLSAFILSPYAGFVSSAPPLDITWLSSLKPFVNIERISISICVRPSIDDDDISALSSSWPKLRHLELEGGDKNGWFHDKKPTLKGIQTLLRNCPQLNYIGMLIDARTRHDFTSPANTRHQHFSTLSVGCTQLEDSDIEHIASFLGSLSTKRLAVQSWGNIWQLALTSEFRKRWDEVNRIISASS